jgi:hypothetical protein
MLSGIVIPVPGGPCISVTGWDIAVCMAMIWLLFGGSSEFSSLSFQSVILI